MSDFIPRETLPDLWEEILQTHWTFLETEESIQKLEERKKLEGCLKEFLCIVPHDRKFFLPETAHVLKKSIKEMTDFSAYKAMIGFESISQYANNLFTKPWRKEYRIIKMYSGFYQHEIKSNLIDADKLFEAMGYKQFPNQILMLDGPICPDQVTNVSRDAMAAYVECQIMKNIFSGLTSMQLSCSWLDIYNFREIHTGGITQAVKSMAYVIQERKYRNDKINSENCYSTIQPHSQATIGTMTSCLSCSHNCQQQQFTNPCNIHHAITTTVAAPMVQQQQTYASVCSIHPQQQQQQNIFVQQQQQNNIQSIPMHQYKPSAVSTLHHNYHSPSQMSHSKSLEHYADQVIPSSSSVILPHRHSFDQPHYDTTVALMGGYDCLDGISTNINRNIINSGQQNCNLNTAYNHPYNVSGNRYPLPYNISAQLNNQLQNIGRNNSGGGNCISSMSNSNSSMVGGHYPLPSAVTLNYGIGGENNHKIMEHDHHLDCNNGISTIYGKNNSQKICTYHHHALSNGGKDLINNHRSHHEYNNYSGSGSGNGNNRNSDQLIDFDERPSLTSDYIQNHNQHRNQQQQYHHPHQHQHHHHQMQNNQIMSSHYDVPKSSILKDLNYSNGKILDVFDVNSFNDDDYHLYSSVVSNNQNEKKSTKSVNTGTNNDQLRRSTDKYSRNVEILEQYQKVMDNNEQKPLGCNTVVGGTQNRIVGGCEEESSSGGDSGGTDLAHHCMKSNTRTLNKNQDGVGSFESWDYVFQNLEKHGYSKDLGERGDLLVQGLNLDLMNINGAIDKRRSRNLDNTNSKISRQTSGVVTATTATTAATAATATLTTTNDNINRLKSNEKRQDSKLKQDVITTLNRQQQTPKVTTSSSKLNENVPAKKFIQSQQVSRSQTQKAQIQKSSRVATTTATTATQNNSSTSMPSSSSSLSKAHILSNNDKNNLNDDQSLRTTLHRLSSNGILVASHCHNNAATVTTNVAGTNGISINDNIGGNSNSNGNSNIISNDGNNSSSSSSLVSAKTTNNISQSVTTTATQIKCEPNEWSCHFCTYLNPDTRRICEMCCRSRDFILDTTNAPTCV